MISVVQLKMLDIKSNWLDKLVLVIVYTLFFFCFQEVWIKIKSFTLRRIIFSLHLDGNEISHMMVRG